MSIKEFKIDLYYRMETMAHGFPSNSKMKPIISITRYDEDGEFHYKSDLDDLNLDDFDYYKISRKIKCETADEARKIVVGNVNFENVWNCAFSTVMTFNGDLIEYAKKNGLTVKVNNNHQIVCSAINPYVLIFFIKYEGFDYVNVNVVIDYGLIRYINNGKTCDELVETITNEMKIDNILTKSAEPLKLKIETAKDYFPK